MSVSEPVFDSYVDKWLAIQPQQRIALAFVDPRRYPGHVAMAVWGQELLNIVYNMDEPHIAAIKLNWWAEELDHAMHGEARHPVTQVLFADPRAKYIECKDWLAPVSAALAQLEEGSAADFSAQLAASSSLHGALAKIETIWWYGSSAPVDRAKRVAVLMHLLHDLMHLEEHVSRARLPLPMVQLARYSLTREQLRTDNPMREQAIKGQLADLLTAWRESAKLAGPVSIFRGVEARHGYWLTAYALRQAQSLHALKQDYARTSLRLTLRTWWAARQWTSRL